jgi:uncharacterized protein YecE (DUF72 family)
VTQYLIGTGGWAYLNVPNKLRSYSQIFNYTEVNYTFYEYPDARRVETWRRTVPKDFVFSVRCHQDLTHRIGLRPVEEAYTTRIKRHDKNARLSQLVDVAGLWAAPPPHSQASYALLQTGLRVLAGSA